MQEAFCLCQKNPQEWCVLFFLRLFDISVNKMYFAFRCNNSFIFYKVSYIYIFHTYFQAWTNAKENVKPPAIRVISVDTWEVKGHLGDPKAKKTTSGKLNHTAHSMLCPVKSSQIKWYLPFGSNSWKSKNFLLFFFFTFFRNGHPSWTNTSRTVLNVTARGSGLSY